MFLFCLMGTRSLCKCLTGVVFFHDPRNIYVDLCRVQIQLKFKQFFNRSDSSLLNYDGFLHWVRV